MLKCRLVRDLLSSLAAGSRNESCILVLYVYIVDQPIREIGVTHLHQFARSATALNPAPPPPPRPSPQPILIATSSRGPEPGLAVATRGVCNCRRGVDFDTAER